MKINRAVILFLALIAVVLLPACGTAKKPVREITVYAQENLKADFTGFAADMKQRDNVSVNLVFDNNQNLMAKLQNNQTADVVVFGSRVMVEQLMKEQYIDNYKLFSFDNTNYYIAKTINSRHYSYGQRFADLVIASERK